MTCQTDSAPMFWQMCDECCLPDGHGGPHQCVCGCTWNDDGIPLTPPRGGTMPDPQIMAALCGVDQTVIDEAWVINPEPVPFVVYDAPEGGNVIHRSDGIHDTTWLGPDSNSDVQWIEPDTPTDE